MRAHLIHNPKAGTSDNPGEDLTKILCNAGIDARYCSVKSPEFPARLEEPADLVVIAGGDGTVRKVMSLLPDRRVPVTILPIGTSNNVARSLGMTGEVHELIGGWKAGKIRRFDIGIAAGPWGECPFIEAVGLGALAAANEKASGGKAVGTHKVLRGRDAFSQRMAEERPVDATIKIDGRKLNDRWILIEALNTRYSGPRLMLSPGADPGDGALDILCVGEDQRSDMLDWLAAPDGMEPPIAPIRGRRLSLRWDGELPLRIDDKLVEARDGKAAKVTVELQDQPLSVLLPARGEQVDERPRPRRKARAKARTAKAGEAGAQARIPKAELLEIERIAVEFANLAGAEITSALGGLLAVRYKGIAEAEQAWRDPVSEVDHMVEQLIRTRLAERFPDHGVIGEEIDEEDPREHDILWVIDPIDGTANFVNGFPMFAASIGVIRQGRPIAGALWCSASHALRAGVYHASLGGKLRFDVDDVVPRMNPEVRRRLAGVPYAAPGRGAWETRKTGSAAIECAFVAAGLLEAARFEAPNLWDVAGGVMLVLASGGTVLARHGSEWAPLDRFEAPKGANIRRWKQPLLIGRVKADALISGLGG
jgi:myo-inositol-1(or 4)-monophosphatase